MIIFQFVWYALLTLKRLAIVVFTNQMTLLEQPLNVLPNVEIIVLPKYTAKSSWVLSYFTCVVAVNQLFAWVNRYTKFCCNRIWPIYHHSKCGIHGNFVLIKNSLQHKNK